MVLVEIPLDLSGIKSAILRKFVKTIDIKVILEIEESNTEIIMGDDYLMHRNHTFGTIPVKMKKAELL
jgi:hypothetical protein